MIASCTAVIVADKLVELIASVAVNFAVALVASITIDFPVPNFVLIAFEISFA